MQKNVFVRMDWSVFVLQSTRMSSMQYFLPEWWRQLLYYNYNIAPRFRSFLVKFYGRGMLCLQFIDIFEWEVSLYYL